MLADLSGGVLLSLRFGERQKQNGWRPYCLRLPDNPADGRLLDSHIEGQWPSRSGQGTRRSGKGESGMSDTPFVDGMFFAIFGLLIAMVARLFYLLFVKGVPLVSKERAEEWLRRANEYEAEKAQAAKDKAA